MNLSRPKGYLVSAIVSTYNAERFLRGKLEDLEAQTIADQLEIIVIDSGSRQNERSIVEEFQKRYHNIRYLRTERRETVYQAWNRGIREASGEFVSNANTDDRLRHDCMETLVRALREHPECVLAYPDMRITNQENTTFEDHEPFGFRDWPPYDRLSLLELCCVGPFPLWRRSLHERIGYFDERYRSAADYEFWLRASEQYDFIHVPQFLGLYWLSPETVSRRGELPTLEYLQIQKQYRARFAPFTPKPAALPDGELARFQDLAARLADGSATQAELESFSELHPGFPEAHHELAQLHYRNDEIGLAKKHFEKAALLEPDSQQYADSLAGFLRLMLYQSLQYHATQNSGSPDELESRLCAGMICILLERFEAARMHYRRALEIEPESALARGNLAALDPPAALDSPALQHSVAPAMAALAEPQLTSIVIVTHNELACTRECLESIAVNTPEPHEIIVADCGSTDGTLPYLRELCAANQNYRLLESDSGTGLAAGRNLGMRLARGNRILLLDSDVVPTRGWLCGMLDCLEREKGAAIVGPMSNAAAGPQRVASAPYRSTAELEEFARGFRSTNCGRRIPVEKIAGFCLLFSRELLEKVGELDATLGTGFQDDDFCLRAALAGFGCVLAADVFMHHYQSRSCQSDAGSGQRPRATRGAAFLAKWDPARLDEQLAKNVVTRNAIVKGGRLARQGRLDQALDLLLQQGIQFSPASREPYLSLAGILYQAGSFANALEVLGEMPKGEELDSILLAGLCLSGLERLDESKECAEMALRLDPDSAGALCLKGTVALRKGDREGAEALFRAGRAADPGFGSCYTALGTLAWDRGDRAAGLNLAEQGFVLSPWSLTALDRFHSYATNLDALPREELRVREALALFPEHQGLAFGLVEILIRRGCYREAMAAIEQTAVDFGMPDALIDAALDIRKRIGPLAPQSGRRATISLCMIVKNEAGCLPAALLSVRSLVDEIIVVDTGSSDRSADIARVFGARLLSFPWNEDFAEARNFSLSQASCDWILVLDADEVLAASDLPPLRALLERCGTPTAYSFTTRNYTCQIGRIHWSANAGEYPAEERGSGWTPSEKVRLFPNDSRLGFRGAVHELLELSLVDCAIPIHACDVPVHHYGKLDTDKSLQKQEQYYLLGLKKLSEPDGDVTSLTELALQATELGRFREAEALWHQLLQRRPDSAEAYFNLGYLHLMAGEYRTARAHALRGAQLAPGMKEAAFNLAKCELFLGDTLEALHGCQTMLQSWPDYPPALSLHCACCLILGRTGDGEALVQQLGQMGFDCGDYLREYADGLAKGERGDLAAPLLRFAEQISGHRAIPGGSPTRERGSHARC